MNRSFNRPALNGWWPDSSPVRLGLVLAAVSAVAGVVGGRLTGTAEVDGYGIINAMPPLYWAGIGGATLATGLLFVGLLAGHRRFGPVIPGLWLVLLHLAPQLAHAHVRFSIVYIHLGFIRLIDTTHTGNILLDARFAWPGFFGAFLAALPPMSMGVLETVMRLWPAMITGASSTMVAALARRSYPTQPLIGTMSSLVFILLSWTGQDYFSPQSVGFFFYLSIIIVVESGPLRARGAWSSVAPILSRFATAGGDRPEARSTPTFVALLVLSFAAVVSHPLAPFFICAGLAMLGLYGRRVAWRLLLVVLVAYVVWFAVAAQPWWATQINDMIHQFASVANVGTAGTERGAIGTPAHNLVLKVRSAIGLSVFVATFVVGVVMGTDRFRHLRPTLPLAPLAGIPVVAAAVQSYGGEMIIRVFLFTLPMASILFARTLLSIRRPAIPVVIPAAVLALVPAFMLARFGNEAFEMVTETDWQAVEVLYENVTPRTLLVTDNSFMPWGDRDREFLVHRYSVAQPTDAWLRGLRAEAQLEVHVGDYRGFNELTAEQVKADKILVLMTPSESAWLHYVEGEPPDSLDAIGRWMSVQPGVTVLYQHDGAWVFELEA